MSDLFDLDDILGEDDIVGDDPLAGVLDAGDDVAGDVKPTTTAATTSPGKPVRRRAIPQAGTLYFDLETIPDYSRESLFDLPAVPEVATFAPAIYSEEKDGPAPSELIRGTEEDFKTAIAKAQGGGKMLPKIILQAALAAESKSEKPKPRKGVMAALGDMIKAIDNEAATIEAAKAANLAAIETAIAARRKTMAVTPEMNRIVALGWKWSNDRGEAMVLRPGEDHDTFERRALEKFWELVKRAKLVVGFNILHFDLPTAFIRSAMLGVEPSKMFDMKPWGTDVCDIMKKRWPSGPAMKLKEFVKRLGFVVPAGDMDGGQVEELVKAGKWEQVRDYVLSDVAITCEVHLFGRGLFW